jgi:hypothetical protein
MFHVEHSTGVPECSTRQNVPRGTFATPRCAECGAEMFHVEQFGGQFVRTEARAGDDDTRDDSHLRTYEHKPPKPAKNAR